MKLCIISDTHTKHWELQDKLSSIEADVLIHCGDITGNGGIDAIEEFMEWFGKLDQFKHKIFIAGNHDWLFERNGIRARNTVPHNVIYLEDEEVIIDGVKFYGTPVQLPFCNWAFNRPEKKLIQHWAAIPDDTDVLITHSPPRTIMDWSVYDEVPTGSPSLYFEVTNRIKPIVHCFGHIHSGHGIKVIEGTTYINASNLDEQYQCVYDPVEIEI